jgi:F420-non-reducing hydrogenase iron-sulfur subunit
MTIKRVTFLQELLGFIGLEDRLHLSWISSAEAGKFVEVVTGFTEKIRSLGPNPLKHYDMQPWLDRLGPDIAGGGDTRVAAPAASKSV